MRKKLSWGSMVSSDVAQNPVQRGEFAEGVEQLGAVEPERFLEIPAEAEVESAGLFADIRRESVDQLRIDPLVPGKPCEVPLVVARKRAALELLDKLRGVSREIPRHRGTVIRLGFHDDPGMQTDARDTERKIPVTLVASG